MKFNNSKLRGRVREVLKTELALANILKIPPSALSARFKGDTQFKRDEIALMIQELGIEKQDIWEYFFNTEG